ncbi:MAG: hypothetical protein AAGH72_04185 [Verrucomicrobiota bacterium]
MKSSLLIILIVLFTTLSEGVCCGIRWNRAGTFFRDINKVGELDYWSSIGKVRLGKYHYPINIIFREKTNYNANYLGAGSQIPLLETKIAQSDENTFKLLLPDGNQVELLRDKKNPTVLFSKGNTWVGEISDSQIDVKASCGWVLKYKNGKIARVVTPDNKFISYKYSGELVQEIIDIESNEVLLSLNYNQGGNLIESMEFEDGVEPIHFDFSERPIVRLINGKPIIDQIQLSLIGIKNSDQKLASYGYPLLENLFPAFEVGGKKTFYFEPLSGKVLRENDWMYSAKVRESNHTTIVRKKLDSDEFESWDYNKGKGVLIVENKDLKTERSWFKSGKLLSRDREITRLDKRTGINTVEKFYYDEEGVLLKKMITDYKQGLIDKVLNKYVEEYTYTPDGELNTIVKRRKTS